MSNFQKVSSWNDIAGNKSPDKPTFPEGKEIELILSLIHEEYTELKFALWQRDMTETIDAIGDLLFVVYGAAHKLGINADDVLREVDRSNLTKFCALKSDAQKTIDKYAENGIIAHMVEVEGIFVVKRTGDNKVLKGVRFEEPNFNGVF